MKRGDIWTVASAGGFAGKPRPAVIVQDDRFVATGSVTICSFTSDPTEAPLFRITVAPSRLNGLKVECRLMADKITTVARSKLEKKVGELAPSDVQRLERALLVFLGLVR